MDSASQFGHSGAKLPQHDATPFSQMSFVFEQLLLKVNTATLVRVVACTNAGDLSPVGYVDVEPLVQQVDGSGNAVAHTIIYNVPYLRVQGGTNAVIIDPAENDIGIACFASRDLSKVKTNRSASLPGSPRVFDYADGMYMGGMLNGTPTQYVQFNEAGVTLVSPTRITLKSLIVELDAPDIVLNGNVSQGAGSNAGTMTLKNDLVSTGKITSSAGVFDGTVRLGTHTHSDDGAGPPNAGT